MRRKRESENQQPSTSVSKERSVGRISAETAIRFWLAIIALIAVASIGPKAFAWLQGEPPLTVNTEQPNPDNIGEIMSEVLSDDIGSFALLFPMIEEAVFADVYPSDRAIFPELQLFAELPSLSPSSASLIGFDSGGAQILSITLNRIASLESDGSAQILLTVRPLQGRVSRQTFILNEAGQQAYLDYLDELADEARRWDVRGIERYSANINAMVTPLELGSESLPDEEVFFQELRRLGMPIAGRESVVGFSWSRHHRVTAEGELVSRRVLHVNMPNEYGADQDLRSFSVQLEGEELIVSNDNISYSWPRTASEFPLIAQLFSQ